jgi:hypothetical protein
MWSAPVGLGAKRKRMFSIMVIVLNTELVQQEGWPFDNPFPFFQQQQVYFLIK